MYHRKGISATGVETKKPEKQTMTQPIQNSTDTSSSSPVADLNDQCRKGENVSKPECQKWFDELSKNKGSVSTGENGETLVIYNPSQPFDDKINKSVSYQVTAKPLFSGCMKKNGRYYGYTQQGSLLDVSQEDCRRLIEEGDRPFNYFNRTDMSSTETERSSVSTQTGQPSFRL